MLPECVCPCSVASLVSNSSQTHGLYSPPGPSVHGIFQARILEWVTIPSSRGSSQPRDQTWVSCIAERLYHCTTREAACSWRVTCQTVFPPCSVSEGLSCFSITRLAPVGLNAFAVRLSLWSLCWGLSGTRTTLPTHSLPCVKPRAHL